MNLQIGDIVLAYISNRGEVEWHWGYLVEYHDYSSGPCWAYYPFGHSTGLHWMLPIEQYGKSWHKPQ